MKARAMRGLVLAAAVLLLISGCAQRTQKAGRKSAPLPAPAVEAEMDNIKRIMSSMTLRDKVGQLFVVRPEALCGMSRSLTPQAEEMYEAYPAGGFCLFKENISEPQQLSEFTAGLHGLGRFAPLLCTDEEGGVVTRIACNPSFCVPVFAAAPRLAESGGAEEVRQSALLIGKYLRDYGFDAVLAPVADVSTAGDSGVAAQRAYSADPEEAAEMVAAAVSGFRDSGTGCCLKHFPGHGGVSGDTHRGFVSSPADWEEMLLCELLPFKAGMAAGADMVMVAHIAAPNVTGTDVPSSLSSEMVGGKLRGEMGYGGLVITDALEMRAVTDAYGSAEAAVAAFEAGCDLLLMPQDYEEAFEAVLLAVLSGRISAERLDESVGRILRFKASRF